MKTEPEHSVSPSQAKALGRRVRRFVGGDGREWIVEESSLPAYSRDCGACLVFYTVDAARRVRNFPGDWFDYSDADLYRLSLRD